MLRAERTSHITHAVATCRHPPSHVSTLRHASMARLFILFAIWLPSSYGMTLSIPHPTSHSGPDANGWSPQVTQAPLPQGIFGSVNNNVLLGRDQSSSDSSLCGYVSGDPNYPIRCTAGNACFWWLGVNVQTCCPVDGDGNRLTSLCLPNTSCVDWQHNALNSTDTQTSTSSTLLW